MLVAVICQERQWARWWPQARPVGCNPRRTEEIQVVRGPVAGMS
jgi:hypothetical protein